MITNLTYMYITREVHVDSFLLLKRTNEKDTLYIFSKIKSSYEFGKY